MDTNFPIVDRKSYQELLSSAQCGLAIPYPERPTNHEFKIGDVGYFERPGEFKFILNVRNETDQEIPGFLFIPDTLVARPGTWNPGTVTRSEGTKVTALERFVCSTPSTCSSLIHLKL